MNMTDQFALVAGASSGIGKATAKVLTDEGARIRVTACSRSKLEMFADEIRADDRYAAVTTFVERK